MLSRTLFDRTIWLVMVWSCFATTPVFADVISAWNEKTVAFLTVRNVPPPQAERVMAMVHLAMFDAVNSIVNRYRPGNHAGIRPGDGLEGRRRRSSRRHGSGRSLSQVCQIERCHGRISRCYARR